MGGRPEPFELVSDWLDAIFDIVALPLSFVGVTADERRTGTLFATFLN